MSTGRDLPLRGEWTSLIVEVRNGADQNVQRAKGTHPTNNGVDERANHRSQAPLAMVARGELSRAARRVTSLGAATGTNDVVRKMLHVALHLLRWTYHWCRCARVCPT